MKIKIGDTIYSADQQPVMIILNDQDKENIKNMSPEATKYCGYPAGTDSDEILKWMQTE
jgi:hypothetical protein